MVTDIQGRIVARRLVQVQRGNNVLSEVPVAQLPTGTYVLLAMVDGELQQVKFVK
jgi:hypothetical protein